MKVIGKVGKSYYSPGGDLVLAGWYVDGTIALHCLASNGEVEYKATVCCPEGTVVPEGHVMLKGWGENVGVPEALAKAGIVELTGRTVTCGYEEAQEARLLVSLD